MARAGTQPKKDNVAENGAKIFSDSILAAFEEAKNLLRVPRQKGFLLQRNFLKIVNEVV